MAVDAVIRAIQRRMRCSARSFWWTRRGQSLRGPAAEKLRRQGRHVVRFLGFCPDVRDATSALSLRAAMPHRSRALQLVDLRDTGRWFAARSLRNRWHARVGRRRRNGPLYPAGSAEELTWRILRADGRPATLAAMRVAAFERGQRHFTIARFLERNACRVSIPRRLTEAFPSADRCQCVFRDEDYIRGRDSRRDPADIDFVELRPTDSRDGAVADVDQFLDLNKQVFPVASGDFLQALHHD